jgi:branched-chain amino acid transport system ATP-binding protein
MVEPILELRAVTVSHGGVAVVRAVSFVLAAGETAVLLGANGAGKSTLLRAVAGLLPLDGGRIVLDGIDVTGMPAERRIHLGLGYVPEGRRVFPGMSVRDNLEVAGADSRIERTRDVDRVFTLFPALAAKQREKAWRLSGGQQQMLALGRALMGHPRLLLLDEPSLGLAPKVAADVFAAVRAIAAEGTAVLVAEQSAERAATLADRRIVLRLGRVEGTGEVLPPGRGAG